MADIRTPRRYIVQIVSQYSSILSPIAVDSVLRLVTPASTNVDLRDIRLVKKVGGTIDDTELMDGLLLHQNVITSAGGPTRIEKAKIGIIQFQLSPPKPDVCRKGRWLDRPLTDCHCLGRWITKSSSMTTVKWTRS
jgi:chaperonin GroEL (HSP60 family)